MVVETSRLRAALALEIVLARTPIDAPSRLAAMLVRTRDDAEQTGAAAGDKWSAARVATRAIAPSAALNAQDAR